MKVISLVDKALADAGLMEIQELYYFIIQKMVKNPKIPMTFRWKPLARLSVDWIPIVLNLLQYMVIPHCYQQLY